ncbi:MAG TPA: carbon-nitrogen hydrolase family protein [Acidimicrobiales bacterium]|jgi:predicted amidohydrolase|nr:carbon-nitrogen hydrolase family protein [Acidimicrobiales bacterium]
MTEAPDLFTVGCVNFTGVRRDKDATLAKIEATIREAAAQGIDLLVFPEEALTGASWCDDCRAAGAPCEYHLAVAETVPGPSSERVAALAAEHGMYVIFGLHEKDPVEPGVLYNAAAVVGPDGIQGTYRKVHLGSPPWVTEGITCRPGQSVPVWQTRWGPIGVLICYDFWLNPELSRILALKGAKLIVNCAASYAGPGKRDYFVHTTEVRALENQVYTASCNHVGGEIDSASYGATGLSRPRADWYTGHSTIAGPAFPRFSQIYVEAGDTEEIVSATLSTKKLERWRSVYPWTEWRRGHQREVSELIAKEFANLY